jgi:hypothetical protein
MLTAKTLERLEAKQRELAELFLDQTKVEDWREVNDKPARGDAFWDKKNAGQTLGLVVRIQMILAQHRGHNGVSLTPGGDVDLAALEADAEREAAKMIARVRANSGAK